MRRLWKAQLWISLFKFFLLVSKAPSQKEKDGINFHTFKNKNVPSAGNRRRVKSWNGFSKQHIDYREVDWRGFLNWAWSKRMIIILILYQLSVILIFPSSSSCNWLITEWQFFEHSFFTWCLNTGLLCEAMRRHSRKNAVPRKSTGGRIQRWVNVKITNFTGEENIPYSFWSQHLF